MRNKIYDIYKALRHFGVSATEIDGIANAYKQWLDDPIDNACPYGTVYYHNGILYAMPYPLKGLSSKEVGIEVHGVIYLNGYVHNVTKDEVAEKLSWLKGEVFAKHPYRIKGVDMPNPIKLELPTAKEAKALFDNAYANRYTKVCNKMGDFWITPSENKPEKTIISINILHSHVHTPKSEDTKATVYGVVHKSSHVFIGKLDQFGILNRETAKVAKMLMDTATSGTD